MSVLQSNRYIDAENLFRFLMEKFTVVLLSGERQENNSTEARI